MKNIKVLCILFFITMISCKKENLQNLPEMSSKDIADNMQKNNFEKRFAELFFEGNLDTSAAISQFDAQNNKREIVPIQLKNWQNPLRFYYILYEKKAGEDNKTFEYIISKTKINTQVDLFSIPIDSLGYVFWDDDNKLKNLIAKFHNGFSDASLSLKFAPNEGSSTICIDWYEVWYNVETGKIIDEIYLYTQCYNTSGGGGGGGGGSVPPNPNSIITTSVSFTSLEDDIGPGDGSYGAPSTTYTYPATVAKIASGQLFHVVMSNTTATPMISSYIDNYNRNTTRTLTLLNHMNT